MDFFTISEEKQRINRLLRKMTDSDNIKSHDENLCLLSIMISVFNNTSNLDPTTLEFFNQDQIFFCSTSNHLLLYAMLVDIGYISQTNLFSSRFLKDKEISKNIYLGDQMDEILERAMSASVNAHSQKSTRKIYLIIDHVIPRINNSIRKTLKKYSHALKNFIIIIVCDKNCDSLNYFLNVYEKYGFQISFTGGNDVWKLTQLILESSDDVPKLICCSENTEFLSINSN